MMTAELNQTPLDPRNSGGASASPTGDQTDAGASPFDPKADSTTDTADPGSLAQIDAGELDELKKKAAKADDHWDRLLRTTADLDNYKKRAARERQEAIKFANEALLEKLVPVLDTFDMALAAASAQNAGSDSFRAGISMIQNQLKSVMKDAGLEEIDASNQNFDPNWHEAVSQKETSDLPEGHVVQQLRKGYKLRDRLLRPATVVVAKKPSS